ncbi:TPA: hypothetical protein ACHYPN_002474 [Yersinia enterocolitica]|uniref:hypothetical protein n=1 Tax=Yersinia TaxID=629 RepID=UPI0005E30FED|nr:hypothetical protein [Yersinia frederiksenii]EKN4831600.1 hypothetical protein [Yersinia enterocolitica]EKN5919471.1 hypothetical protein [Yersinia enterocolitica]EKN6263147.1 hypothetical protein [Yersinia enterocolitica]ELI8130144.1 hypothetical protein [Yersinia enterocolitica]ELI8163438.1 hypothetical protein [Yersinia enterocolitica]
MKNIFMVIILLGLSGCATTAVKPSNALQAPKERVFLYQNLLPGASQLTVVRDSGFLGGGCYAAVFLNGKKAASLNPGEKVSFYLLPGEWMIGFQGEGKVCIADELPTEQEINLKAGQSKGVRLFSDPSGNLDIKPISLN